MGSTSGDDVSGRNVFALFFGRRAAKTKYVEKNRKQQKMVLFFFTKSRTHKYKESKKKKRNQITKSQANL